MGEGSRKTRIWSKTNEAGGANPVVELPYIHTETVFDAKNRAFEGVQNTSLMSHVFDVVKYVTEDGQRLKMCDSCLVADKALTRAWMSSPRGSAACPHLFPVLVKDPSPMGNLPFTHRHVAALTIFHVFGLTKPVSLPNY
eukprot:TRINITY_DN6649_c0_g1_i1.p1 TRINITY_DN6649_c0_g1~~TRINITY_DN6649_c0_g1_i1.p1  ORF type:complete len:140 (-),score=6.10 TRINITY_DN6649_c0_g1_i1:528-947(-)